MQPHGQTPVRPVPLQGGADLQQLLEIVRVQQQQQSQQPNRSAFSTLPTQQALLPEFQLYHAAQLSGLLVNNNQANVGEPLQLAQLQQLHNLSNQANILNVPGGSLPDSSTTRNPPARPASRSNEKSSTAYASRHQAAEQRRRNRINDRLDLLRKVVPHSERANTATFLEEVIKYVGELQTRVTALESAQGLPLSCPPKQGVNQALHQLSQPSQKILSVGPEPGDQSAPVMSNLSQPLSIFPESMVNTSNAAQSALQKDRPGTPSQSSGEVEGGGELKKEADDCGPAHTKRARSGSEPEARNVKRAGSYMSPPHGGLPYAMACLRYAGTAGAPTTM